MDQFEKQFENLDIQAEFVDNAMNAQAALSTPEDDVNMLVQQVAEEHNLENMLNFPAAGKASAAPTAQPADKSDLSSRLAQLHNQK
jgi:charged multivesicular body protein 1